VRPFILPAVVTAGVIGLGSASAQPATTTPAVPTVDEAVVIAHVERAHPELERLAADADLARADVVAAGIRAEPSIALDREEVFPDDGLATHYARLDVPLDVSGRRGRRVAAARAAADAVVADGKSARTRVVVDALRVFYEAAYARLALELLRADREGLVRAVQVIRKRADAGAASGYDLQRIELELTTYDGLIADAEARLFEAQTLLAALLGKPDGFVDASSTLPLPARPTGLPDGGAVLQSRGDYQAAQLRARSADRLAEEARRGWIPSLGLSAGAMSQDTGDDTAVGYTVGLSFTLPVFDRGRATAARASAMRRAAGADTRRLQLTVPAQVRAKAATLERRIAQSEQLTTSQLSRLEPLLRSAETAYREGHSSVVELLDAYAAARTIRLRDLELRRDARLAELDLWLALDRRP
jgi:outer membrane protein, heavy metal efflux system